MRRLLTVSALFALFATAAAQPPGSANQPQPKPTDKKAEKKTDPTDAAIAAALANDPDVKMAQAKMQLAEAEHAKARHAVTIKVVTLKAKIEQLKGQLVPLEKQAETVSRSVKGGGASVAELYPVMEKLEAAKSALALAEAEWKILTGGSGASPLGAADPNSDKLVPSALQWLRLYRQQGGNPDASAALLAYLTASEIARERAAVKGPIPDRIRAALDKPVKLGAKGEKVSFEKALEVFKKEAGLDVPIRGKFPPNALSAKSGERFEIVSEGEEMPVGAWFQLFEDNAVSQSPEGPVKYQIRVREYGLLITTKDAAPPDAPTLTEFWKQKPPAKEAKDEPKK